jgi:hypothetical protein
MRAYRRGEESVQRADRKCLRCAPGTAPFSFLVWRGGIRRCTAKRSRLVAPAESKAKTHGIHSPATAATHHASAHTPSHHTARTPVHAALLSVHLLLLHHHLLALRLLLHHHLPLLLDLVLDLAEEASTTGRILLRGVGPGGIGVARVRLLLQGGRRGVRRQRRLVIASAVAGMRRRRSRRRSKAAVRAALRGLVFGVVERVGPDRTRGIRLAENSVNSGLSFPERRVKDVPWCLPRNGGHGCTQSGGVSSGRERLGVRTAASTVASAGRQPVQRAADMELTTGRIARSSPAGADASREPT